MSKQQKGMPQFNMNQKPGNLLWKHHTSYVWMLHDGPKDPRGICWASLNPCLPGYLQSSPEMAWIAVANKSGQFLGSWSAHSYDLTDGFTMFHPPEKHESQMGSSSRFYGWPLLVMSTLLASKLPSTSIYPVNIPLLLTLFSSYFPHIFNAKYGFDHVFKTFIMWIDKPSCTMGFLLVTTWNTGTIMGFKLDFAHQSSTSCYS